LAAGFLAVDRGIRHSRQVRLKAPTAPELDGGPTDASGQESGDGTFNALADALDEADVIGDAPGDAVGE
jgi:hypothetical protein